MKNDYEQRISELESRLSQAERLANSATRDAEEAYEIAEQSAIDQSAGSSSPNAFNPGVGAVLAALQRHDQPVTNGLNASGMIILIIVRINRFIRDNPII